MCAKLALRAAYIRMRTVPRQAVSDKSAERIALRNFATDDASPNAIPIAGEADARPGSDAQPARPGGRAPRSLPATFTFK